MSIIARVLFCVFVSVCVTAEGKSEDQYLVEVYENWGNASLDNPPVDMPPIVLSVPPEFRYGSSKGAVRNWGLNILTYYPSFTSPQAPENAQFGLKCAGDCNGRILISIENKAHAIRNPSLTRGVDYFNMGDLVAHVRPLVPNGAELRERQPEPGFDRSYEVVELANGAHENRVTRYLLRLGSDRRHYDLAVKCSTRTCTLHFSLRCNPAIYVQVVAIDMRHLSQLADVELKADQFVSSMVRSPACAPSTDKQ